MSALLRCLDMAEMYTGPPLLWWVGLTKRNFLIRDDESAGRDHPLTLSSGAERQRGETSHENINNQIHLERRRNVANRF
jgi:hypothetical protein